jgi:hypothetical protein
MLVKRGGARPAGLAIAAIVVGLVAAGCAFSKPQPTPIYILITPAPTPSPSATPLPTDTPTPLPTLSDTPTPEPTPSPTQRPVATTAPYTLCVPAPGDKQYWTEASSAMSWDVYCPVLPSGWFVTGGSYDGSAGTIHMAYGGPGGATLVIDEGAFCTSSAATCSPHSTVVGTTEFGDLTGSLDTLADGGLAVYINAGTATGYSLTGASLSQADFTSIAATLVKVAKS